MSRHPTAGAHRSPARNTNRRRTPVRDRLLGLASLLALLVLLLGIPAALLAMGGSPLPDTGADLGALVDRLTAPDDGTLFLAALAWIAWLAWASFALSVAVEAAAQVRGLPSPRLPALAPQQRVAGALVATAALLFTAPLLTSPAVAAPGGSSAVAMTSSTQSLDTAVGAPVARVGTDPVAPEARPVHKVQPGDSLWQIAEQTLGDGGRFSEIADLNYQVPQRDGGSLQADHWLRPGWELILPSNAIQSPLPGQAGVEPPTTVVVQPGDTLWEIARETLGDGSRYPEIAAASAGVQADGERLTDPDLIRPGWHLQVPTETNTSASLPDQAGPAVLPVQPVRPAPHEAPPGATGPNVPSSAAELVEQAPPADAGAGSLGSDEELDTEEPSALRTTAGVGGLLAAGLLLLLAARRRRQQRRRRFGQRITMPDPDLASTESELRAVEDPIGHARVDQALRALSALLGDEGRTLPALRLVRLAAGHLELYLADETELPAPFAATSDPTAWTLAADAVLPHRIDAATVPSPYPSLVTVGHDLDDAHVLVDLEHVGSLSLVASRERGVAVLAALAVELATTAWADDLQVTLVGCLPQLPDALGTGRVRHVPDLELVLPVLEHRALAIRANLEAVDAADVQHARTGRARFSSGDAWTPEILLIADNLSPSDQERLDLLLEELPGVGPAAIAVTDRPAGAWSLTLASDDGDQAGLALLEPVGVALRPQLLTDESLNRVLALLAVADHPAEDSICTGPTAIGDAGQEPSLAELGTNLIDSNASVRLALLPEDQDVAGDGMPPTDEDGEEDRAAEGTGSTSAAERPPAQERSVHPMLQLLGPVELLQTRGTVERGKQRQLTEIAAYLALHPGLDHTHLSEAIWPGARALDNTRNTALSKLRKWLGATADGEDYVPRVLKDGYRLHPAVRTDWDLWRECLPEGPGAADTPALAAALDLVKGKPFAGTNPRRYAWAERVRQDMISAIVDVAHELARRALLEGDATLARRAVAAGLQADPGAELLWRDALRAEWLAGDREGLTATADRLSALADELGDDLEPETLDLLDELLNRPIQKSGTR